MQPSQGDLLAQLRKGVLEYCVLAQLRLGPAYGLELAASLSAGSTLLGSKGSLYPLLARLRKQGWVETSWEASASGPSRRYYALTEQGRTVLTMFNATWGVFSADVASMMEGPDGQISTATA